jgi:hypothetical protein
MLVGGGERKRKRKSGSSTDEQSITWKVPYVKDLDNKMELGLLMPYCLLCPGLKGSSG